jgi:hypothetical protein
MLGTSLVDNKIPDNQMTASQTQASNASSRATIVITMYAVDDE